MYNPCYLIIAVSGSYVGPLCRLYSVFWCHV